MTDRLDFLPKYTLLSFLDEDENEVLYIKMQPNSWFPLNYHCVDCCEDLMLGDEGIIERKAKLISTPEGQRVMTLDELDGKLIWRGENGVMLARIE